MIHFNRLKASYFIALLMTSTLLSAAPPQCLPKKPCACPDMSQYTGTTPEGWSVRFNEKIIPNKSNRLQVVIMERVDKKSHNNFYCRYINNDGATFVLSTSIPAKTLHQSSKTFWAYDHNDDLWECHPQSHKGSIRTQQCGFSLI